MDNVEQLVKEFIIKEFAQDKPGIELSNQNLVESGIIDSLGILMLISYIEAQFGVNIQPEDVVMENFSSIGAIKQLIQQRGAAQ